MTAATSTLPKRSADVKKEIFAIAVLMLLASVSVWNTCHAKKLTSDLSDILNASKELAENDQWQYATALAETALNKWKSAGTYTQVFIGHNSVELTTDAFGDYLSELYRCDMGGALGTHKKLVAHINAIYEMEKISLKSIF